MIRSRRDPVNTQNFVIAVTHLNIPCAYTIQRSSDRGAKLQLELYTSLELNLTLSQEIIGKICRVETNTPETYGDHENVVLIRSRVGEVEKYKFPDQLT